MTLFITASLSLGLLWFMTSPYVLPVVREIQTLVTKIIPAQGKLPNVKTESISQGDPTAQSYSEDTDAQASNGARWSKNTATVYLEASDERFRTAYLRAIENWNQTGAFNFDLTDDKKRAQIILKQQNDANTSAAGVTHTMINQLTNRLTSADVYLNSYYLLNAQYGYSQLRITNTAEHELGHAIGLAHDDENVSVMQSAGSYYSIQPKDIEAVKALYQEG